MAHEITTRAARATGLSDASAVLVARALIGCLLLGPWVWPMGLFLLGLLRRKTTSPYGDEKSCES